LAVAVVAGSIVKFRRKSRIWDLIATINPGDANLTVLRNTFFLHWLLAKQSSRREEQFVGWQAGKELAVSKDLISGAVQRSLLQRAEAQTRRQTVKLMTAAANAARREGFPQRTIIFLDIEEGGRMLPEQKDYIYTWGGCGDCRRIQAGRILLWNSCKEGKTSVVTAEDIRENAPRDERSVFGSRMMCVRRLQDARLPRLGYRRGGLISRMCGNLRSRPGERISERSATTTIRTEIAIRRELIRRPFARGYEYGDEALIRRREGRSSQRTALAPAPFPLHNINDIGPDVPCGKGRLFCCGRHPKVVCSKWLQHPRGLGLKKAASPLEPLSSFQHPRFGMMAELDENVRFMRALRN